MPMQKIVDAIITASERNPLPPPQHFRPLTLADYLKYHPQPCPYPLPWPSAPPRALFDRHAQAGRTYWGEFHRRGDAETARLEKVAAWRAYQLAMESCRLALPFETDVAYAYLGRMQRGSNDHQGGLHITTKAPFTVGRLVRKPGDALCKPAARFWGLDGGRAGLAYAHCVTCADKVEQLIRKLRPDLAELWA